MGANSKKEVEEIVKVLGELGENESIVMKVTEELEDIDAWFKAEIGYFAKNGQGSYAIRLMYGRTPLLKIRNTMELEAIAKLVEHLKKNQKYIKALDQLNKNKKSKRTRKEVQYI